MGKNYFQAHTSARSTLVLVLGLLVWMQSPPLSARDLHFFVVDKSGSIAFTNTPENAALRTNIIQAVNSYVSGLSEKDEVRLVFFNDKPTSPKTFASMGQKEKQDLKNYFEKEYALDKITGATRLYDTVADVLQEIIRNKDKDKYNKIEIRILSDGKDENFARVNPGSSEELYKKVGEQYILDKNGNLKNLSKHRSWNDLVVYAQKVAQDPTQPFIYWYAFGFKSSEEEPSAHFEFIERDLREPMNLSTPPKAQIKIRPTEPCVGEPVEFTAVAGGGEATNWVWIVNGVTNTGTETSHTFTIEGVVDVVLQVFGPGGTSESKKQLTIVPDTPLVANFDWMPKKPRQNVEVTFFDESIGAPDSWTWEIDGKTNTGRRLVIPFVKEGDVEIVLTVRKEGKDDSTSRKTITILPLPLVKASFITPDKVIRVGETVRFIDTSDGSPSKRRWTYPGAEAIEEPYPEITFDKDGDIPLTLTVTHADGRSDSVTNQITVLPLPPQAEFKFSEDRHLVRKPVTLRAIQSHTTTEHSWLVDGVKIGGGLGQNSVEWTPYRDGLHSVTHIASNTGGATTNTPMPVQVYKPLKAVIEVVTKGDLRSGQSVSFTADGSEGDIASYHWDFGDDTGLESGKTLPHTYTNASNYTVTLTVSGPDGSHTDSQSVTIIDGFHPKFTVTPRKGSLSLRGKSLTVQATDRTTPQGRYTYLWDFGDGKPSTTETDPKHTYDSVSNFIVRLTVTDSTTGVSNLAPEMKIEVLENTQQFFANVITALLAFVSALIWFLWILPRRKPKLKECYRLGEGKLSNDIITIGLDKYKKNAEHDISWPVVKYDTGTTDTDGDETSTIKTNVFGHLASLKKTNTEEGEPAWMLTEEAGGVNLVYVVRAGNTLMPGVEGINLEHQDEIRIAGYAYTFEKEDDVFALKRHSKPDKDPLILYLIATGVVIASPQIIILLIRFG